mmetsp:Transcript_17128/g.56219  ORF Transcript_17128/g.56219 Transcript_17128/m.56219 type:complete len:228 (+) Transcript_17128:1299-1982(+)
MSRSLAPISPLTPLSQFAIHPCKLRVPALADFLLAGSFCQAVPSSFTRPRPRLLRAAPAAAQTWFWIEMCLEGLHTPLAVPKSDPSCGLDEETACLQVAMNFTEECGPCKPEPQTHAILSPTNCEVTKVTSSCSLNGWVPDSSWLRGQIWPSFSNPCPTGSGYTAALECDPNDCNVPVGIVPPKCCLPVPAKSGSNPTAGCCNIGFDQKEKESQLALAFHNLCWKRV